MHAVCPDRSAPRGNLPALWATTLLLVACVSTSSASAQPRIEGLGTLAGSAESRAFGASSDGCIVVGRSGEAFIHEKDWMRALREGGLASAETAVAVSDDGVSAVGNDGSGTFGVTPTLAWRSVFSFVTEIPGTPFEFSFGSVANDVSQSGTAIVGSGAAPVVSDTYPWEAFRYEEAIGFTYLDSHPTPIPHPDSSASSAEAVSADGSIAVGWARWAAPVWNGSSYDTFREAVRWDGTTLSQLGFAAGATSSEATGISADGSVIVGFSGDVGFRFANGALEEIGSMVPSDVSVNGDVIVGQSAGGAAQIWDATDGQRDLATWLASVHGVDLAGWTLDRVEAVSDDGRTFVGTGTNPSGGVEAWRVALDNPCVSVITPLPGLDDTWWVAALPNDSAIAVSFFASHGDRVLIIPRYGAQIDVADAALVSPILASGPGDTFYGLNLDQQNVVRIDLDGTVTTLFDVSDFSPPLDLATVAPPYIIEQFGAPPDGVYDFDIESDGSVVVTTLQSVIRIDPAGDATVLVDPAMLSDLLEAGPFDYFTLAQLEVDAGGTIYVQALCCNGGHSILELPASGAPTVHRSQEWIAYMELSPGGELWVLGDGGAARVHGDPIVLSPGVGIITHPITLEQFTIGSDARRFTFAPDGELLVQASSNQLLGLDPLVYDFATDPARFVAGPELQPIPVSAIASFATSDRAVYVTTFSDSIIRIPRHFGTPACSDGADNDGDGRIDWPDDKGCTRAEDEAEHQSTRACDDGVDNDGDGLVDFGGGDPGCAGPRFDDEAPQCDDGINNDPNNDADIDMADARCKSPADPSERCGLGFELALILPLLRGLRRLRYARND